MTILTNFFSNIRSNSSAIDSELRLKAERFQAHLTHKFDWDFEIEELDEDQPVVVDIEDPWEHPKILLNLSIKNKMNDFIFAFIRSFVEQ